jgi:hypothetical protein
MTTETVVVSSNPYDVYANAEQADLYLQANFLAAAWFDLTLDQKGQLLVTATRLFDRQCWLGEKTEENQPLQWPRTGITDIEDNIVPQGIIDGSIEMAFAIFDGNEAVSNSQPGAQKLRSIAAGSVNLQWFRGAEGLNARFDRFPLPVQELIGKWLCSGQMVSTLITSGAGGISITKDDLGLNEGV